MGPATDPRVKGTLRAIEQKLVVDGEFVLRYEPENTGDGLPPGEGAFLACSFWLVDNYILQGRHVEARKLFERLLSHCNDVGLLAEEFDPRAGRMLGNFPQAYSHVGLINCALNLSREVCPAEERAAAAQWTYKGQHFACLLAAGSIQELQRILGRLRWGYLVRSRLPREGGNGQAPYQWFEYLSAVGATADIELNASI